MQHLLKKRLVPLFSLRPFLVEPIIMPFRVRELVGRGRHLGIVPFEIIKFRVAFQAFLREVAATDYAFCEIVAKEDIALGVEQAVGAVFARFAHFDLNAAGIEIGQAIFLQQAHRLHIFVLDLEALQVASDEIALRLRVLVFWIFLLRCAHYGVGAYEQLQQRAGFLQERFQFLQHEGSAGNIPIACGNLNGLAILCRDEILNGRGNLEFRRGIVQKSVVSKH